jgi:hypothetical protein
MPCRCFICQLVFLLCLCAWFARCSDVGPQPASLFDASTICSNYAQLNGGAEGNDSKSGLDDGEVAGAIIGILILIALLIWLAWCGFCRKTRSQRDREDARRFKSDEEFEEDFGPSSPVPHAGKSSTTNPVYKKTKAGRMARSDDDQLELGEVEIEG